MVNDLRSEEERTVKKGRMRLNTPRGGPQKGAMLGVQEVSPSETVGVHSTACFIEVKGHKDMDLTK